MNNPEEFEKLWQSQHAPELSASRQSNEGLIEKLKVLKKKWFAQNLFSTLALLATARIITWVAASGMVESKIAIGGIYLIFFDIMMIMVVFWIKGFRLGKKQLSLSNLEFINYSIHKIQNRKKISTIFIPIYSFILILGINLYLDILDGASLTLRVTVHIGLTLLMLMAFYFGLKRSIRIFNSELNPLINELKAISEEIKRGAQLTD